MRYNFSKRSFVATNRRTSLFNDPLAVARVRNHMTDQNPLTQGIEKQQGTGINIDTVMRIYKPNQVGNGIIDNILLGKKSTKLRNLISKKLGKSFGDPNTYRPMYAGEKHALLKLPNGRMGFANYMGPHTQVIKRLRRNDPARTPADACAKRHDIDFSIQSSNKNKADKIKKIREADMRMSDCLKRIRKNKSDRPMNIRQGELINTKMRLENMKLLNREKFVPYEPMATADMALLKSEEKKMKQQGYGVLPAEKLRRKLLKKIKNGKLKNVSMDKTYPNETNYQVGTGFLQVLQKQLIPKMKKELGIKSVPNIVPLLKKVNTSKNMPSDMKKISQALVDVLVASKLGKGQKGNGMMKKYLKSGKGAGLGKLMYKFLMPLFKSYSSKSKSKDKYYPVSRAQMEGGSFFKQFWSGFKKGFGKTLEVLSAPVGLLTGMPIAGTIGSQAGKLIQKL